MRTDICIVSILCLFFVIFQKNSILAPEKYEGYLLKKKKWPMKGWHKVGFIGQKSVFLSIIRHVKNGILGNKEKCYKIIRSQNDKPFLSHGKILAVMVWSCEKIF